jgi:hypothetical protein
MDEINATLKDMKAFVKEYEKRGLEIYQDMRE